MSAMDDAMSTLRTAVDAAIAKARADAVGPAVGAQETADAAKVAEFAAQIEPLAAEPSAPQ
jgi:hypothetical protein